MKMALPAALLCGLLVARGVEAQEENIQHSRWVIIATVIERTTGRRLKQSRLQEPELQFDAPGACRSVLNRVEPVVNDYVAVILTCKQVGPEDRRL